jgi:hypothetical protein
VAPLDRVRRLSNLDRGLEGYVLSGTMGKLPLLFKIRKLFILICY